MFNKIKQSIKDSLLFANLIDSHDNKLSWTTIALVVALFSFVNTHDPAALGGLLLALLARSHKKQLSSKVDKDQDVKLEALMTEINTLKELRPEIDKVKQEAKYHNDLLNMVNNKVNVNSKR